MKKLACMPILLCVLLCLLILPCGAAGKVTDVRITAQPAKLTYTAGDSFDPTGMVITITYEDGTTELADASDYTFSPTDALSTVHTRVVIDCAGKKLTLPITVLAASGEGTAAVPQGTSSSKEAITTPALTVPTSPAQEKDTKTFQAVRTDRQGQSWNFFHWTLAILLIFAVTVSLVMYYRRNFGNRR